MATAPALELPNVDPSLITEHEHVLGVQTIVDVDRDDGASYRISILPAADSTRYGELAAFGHDGPVFPPLLGYRDVAVLDQHGIVGDGELWHITDDEARAVVGRALEGNLTDFGVDR